MSVLLQVKNVSKHYGARVLLEGATASFSRSQKIGMIGRNGAGKSTLCRIMPGQEEPDEGSVARNQDLKLGYLEQHDPYKPEETVIGFLERYTGAEEWRCAEMAGRFHIQYEKLEAPIKTLPGGYRTRVKLAAMLLAEPNFLVLDEPTNYLDLSTLILLENLLLDFNGGYLIVSHDREFLKRTCDHTLEVEHGKLALYPGGIEDYLEFKEEQLRQKLAYNKTVEKKKEQLQEFVDRFKAKASTATRAKSKMKMIDKLETIEIAHSLGTVRIRLPAMEMKDGVALTCNDLKIGYPDKTVVEKISLDMDRGRRVAVLGDNGQGKTTFLRTLAGDLQPLGGSFRWGTGLKVGYYAQHVFTALRPEDDVLTALSRYAADGVKQQDILDMAGSFLFSGDETRKIVKVLSGGERARLCLAGLLLTKSNILLLDEPTNHLDFETVEALGRALHGYAGTLFFISHDRTFVNLIATNILDIKDGFISKYPGSYEDYVYHLEAEARGEREESHSGKHSGENKEKKKSKAQEQSKPGASSVPAEVEAFNAKIQKLKTKMDHWQKQCEALRKEREANPFHFSRERKDKLRELEVLVENGKQEMAELEGKRKAAAERTAD